MRRSGWQGRALVLGALVVFAGLTVFAFVRGRAEFAEERERERPVNSPIRVTISDNQAVVSLDPAASEAASLVMLRLVPRAGAVLLPFSAIVWSEGKPWAYMRSAPGRYSRRGVPLGTVVEDGWLLPGKGWQGAEVVLAGGQMLLSEEFRADLNVGDND